MTVKESLMRLPEPYGEMAVKLAKGNLNKKSIGILSRDICYSFSWGVNVCFWHSIFLDADYHEQNDIPFK